MVDLRARDVPRGAQEVGLVGDLLRRGALELLNSAACRIKPDLVLSLVPHNPAVDLGACQLDARHRPATLLEGRRVGGVREGLVGQAGHENPLHRLRQLCRVELLGRATGQRLEHEADGVAGGLDASGEVHDVVGAVPAAEDGPMECLPGLSCILKKKCGTRDARSLRVVRPECLYDTP